MEECLFLSRVAAFEVVVFLVSVSEKSQKVFFIQDLSLGFQILRPVERLWKHLSLQNYLDKKHPAWQLVARKHIIEPILIAWERSVQCVLAQGAREKDHAESQSTALPPLHTPASN